MPATRKRLRWAAHCRYGDSIDIRSAHLDTIVHYQDLWDKYHRMAGCEPVTAAQAGAIRRKLNSGSPEPTT